MNPLFILLGVAAWGITALLLLVLALRRAHRLLYRPTPREGAPSTTCRSCRLPFHRSSWRCGRCGAFLRPFPFYLLGRGVFEPLLRLLVVPWILGVGLLLSFALWVSNLMVPQAVPVVEQTASRLGAWVSPLFQPWIPQRWRLPVSGTRVLPREIDAPGDMVVASALTLAGCLLEQSDEEIEVEIPHPCEETMRLLRDTPSGIHEIWGYISDGHPLTPCFRDQIIAARFHGQSLMEYVDGLAHHLEETLNQIEIRPRFAPAPDGVPPRRPEWSFLLRREPPLQGRYPLRWEVHAPQTLLLHIEDIVSDLEVWDNLPCSLIFQ